MPALSKKFALLRLAGMLLDRFERWLKQTSTRRRGPAAESPVARRVPAAPAQRYDSSRSIERRPAAAVPAVAPKILITTDKAEDITLSAQGLRRRLRDPQALRQAILINEILDKPLALRQRRRT